MFPIMLAQGERPTRAGLASCLHQVSEQRLQAGMSAMDESFLFRFSDWILNMQLIRDTYIYSTKMCVT